MFQFELHPHIGEIRMDIFDYEKYWVIKLNKVPARVKVNRNSLKYHYNKGKKSFYQKCYSTSSRIFHITSESEDEQRLVLVSAHPPPKLPTMET